MNAAPLVRIRCGTGGCRRPLIEFYDSETFNAVIAEIRAAGDVNRARRTARRPTDWSGKTQLGPCPRHDKTDLTFFDFAKRRRADGRPLDIVMRFVEHADLRQMFYLADTTGRTQEDNLKRGVDSN